MKTWLFAGALGAILVTTPAAADHTKARPAPGPETESSLDLQLSLGPKSFRFGSRLLRRDGGLSVRLGGSLGLCRIGV